MSDWKTEPFEKLCHAVASSDFWHAYLEPLVQSPDQVPFSVHLAVFRQPYLTYMLEGAKTVESRFSLRRRAPYERVGKSDVLLLKASGGPVVGLCRVCHVWFYQLTPGSWKDIRKTFAEQLCAQDPGFWKEREHASFATLMEVEHVFSIAPVSWRKRDRRGWVVLQPRTSQADLEFD